MDKQQLHHKLNNLFSEYKFNISDADKFKLILEYQATQLENISINNNDKSRVAIARTSMYEISYILARYKKNKSKQQLFRLVNIFSLTCKHYAYDRWDREEVEIWSIILNNGELIIGNSKWYERVIPESKWILDYLTEQSNE